MFRYESRFLRDDLPLLSGPDYFRAEEDARDRTADREGAERVQARVQRIQVADRNRDCQSEREVKPEILPPTQPPAGAVASGSLVDVPPAEHVPAQLTAPDSSNKAADA